MKTPNNAACSTGVMPAASADAGRFELAIHSDARLTRTASAEGGAPDGNGRRRRATGGILCFRNPAGEAFDDPGLGGGMLTNPTEIGTARLPLRRSTRPTPTDASPNARRPGLRARAGRARAASLRPDFGPLGLEPHAHRPDRRHTVPAVVPLLHDSSTTRDGSAAGIATHHPEPRRGRPCRHPGRQRGPQGGRLHRRRRRPRPYQHHRHGRRHLPAPSVRLPSPAVARSNAPACKASASGRLGSRRPGVFRQPSRSSGERDRNSCNV